MLRLPNRNLAVAIAAITGFGTAAPVLIEHIILLDADLADPSAPVLWKRRHKRHCRIPRIGFFLVPGQKLLFPNPFLKLPDRRDRTPFGMQIPRFMCHELSRLDDALQDICTEGE